MARLEIHLLGPFQLTLEGVPVSGFDSDKVRALLAYLAVEGEQPQRREKLAGLLWPEYPERSARTSLRSALANLRQVIDDQEADPPFLLVTRQNIQFNRNSDHELDVHSFTARLAGKKGQPPNIAELEEAATLYQGNFLEGFSILDSAPFEEWALITRESLQGQVIRVLHKLTSYYQEQDDYERALHYAHRQLELDPFQESAHQQMMWQLALSGQRNQALSHFEAYRQLLESELGVAPLEDTKVMYEKISEGELPTPPTETIILRREPREVGESPYRGLAAFREVDAPFFFGREDFTARLTDTVQKRALVAVIVGSSGSGKSSTVFAGLIPQLKESRDWLILQCRPRGHPFQALAGAFLPILEPKLGETDQLIETHKLAEALREGDLPLYQVARSALQKSPETNRLLLVVDQFEELYTLCPEPEERRRFMDELLSMVEAEAEQHISPIVLLLTLRADFMGQALSHRPFADALQDGSLILGPMNRAELRAAIEKPAEMQGAAFETGLVTRLLDDVGDEPGNLPLLEFALALLWERLDQGWLTHAAYDEIGRVDGALARYAEQVFTELDKEDQVGARRVFVQLVQPGEGTEDTRRLALRGEFEVEQWRLIQHLADKRLVVTGQDQAGNETTEVVHEALIRGWHRLGVWMEADRVFRTWQEGLRAAIRQWESSDRDAGALLRGVPLAQAEGWLVERRSDLSSIERTFIQASADLRAQEQARREQRRRRIIVGLATGLVIALVLALLAGQQWLRAEDAGELAIARQVTAQSASTLAVGERAAAQTAQAQEAAQRATAQANAVARTTAQALAEEQARQAFSRELAAAAIANLDVDPERSILLALQAESQTYQVDQTILQEAEEALHRSVQASRLRQTIRSNDEIFYLAKFNPDGSRFITWSYEEFPGFTRVWSTDTGEELLTLPGIIPLAALPMSNEWSAFEPDYENNIDIYTIRDFESGEPSSTTSIPLPSGQPFRYAVDQNLEHVARALYSGETEIWDLRTGQEILHLGWEGRPLDTAVAFSPLGDRLVTGNNDGVVSIWDIPNGVELLTITGHTGRVMKVAFSPDSDYIATASGDGTAKLWDSESGQELVTFTSHTNEIMSLVFSPDGVFLATGSWDRTVKIWDVKASMEAGIGVERLSLAGHTSFIWDIDISRNGENLVSAGEDGTLRIWDIRPEGSSEGKVFINGPPTGSEWAPGMALSSDGARLATTNADTTPKVWDTQSGEILHTLSSHQDRVQRIEFSPDSATIVTTGKDNTIKGWDATSGEELFSLSASGFDCTGRGVSCDIAFSPDGKTLAIVDNNGTLKVFDYQQLLIADTESPSQELLTITAHDDWIWDVAHSRDGQQIATTSRDGSAKIWDAETGEHVNTLSGHQGSVYGVTYSPDGKQIVTTSSDGTAKVWEVQTGDLLFTLSGHSASVIEAVFSPDGTQIATASLDGTAKLWNADTGQEKQTLYGHTAGVSDVAFSPDGKTLYTASQDGTNRVHLLDIDELMELARARVTRGLTEEECKRYLRQDKCPEAP